ncbi:MAG: HPr family phosphocarrier protein [Inquilinus sp.]|nr:HPr family phosphocarrier protein [Inquilinus sp.]
MVSRAVTILNRRGLHARAAAKFVKLAGTYRATVRVARNGMDVGGDSIMGLMMLAAGLGSTITLTATGAEAAAAVKAIVALINRKFDED